MSIKIVKFDETYEPLLGTLTELLHEAYKVLVAAGMTATVQQDFEATQRRLSSGDSFLGFVDSKLVATITLVRNAAQDPIEWYSKPGVFHFTQFAVDVKVQGHGYGKDLLKFVESFAKGEGAAELALDTSEKADGLIDWYKKRGYRLIGHCSLPATTYRSVVLSKSLSR